MSATGTVEVMQQREERATRPDGDERNSAVIAGGEVIGAEATMKKTEELWRRWGCRRRKRFDCEHGGGGGAAGGNEDGIGYNRGARTRPH